MVIQTETRRERKKERQYKTLMIGRKQAVFVVFFLFLGINKPAFAADISSLTWSADSGIRLSGSEGTGANAWPFVMSWGNGTYGMYSYEGDEWTYGNTGYATSTNGLDWTRQTQVMTHGGNGYDNVNAVITSIVPLPGSGYLAYCSGMSATQNSSSSIFYADGIQHAESPDGIQWTKKSVLLDCTGWNGQIYNPRVYPTANGYVMYFARESSDQGQVCRATSSDGIQWSTPVHVAGSSGQDFIGSFDIVERPGGGLRMYASTLEGDIASLISTNDGLSWVWDERTQEIPGTLLTPTDFGIQGGLQMPFVINIDGTVRMYVNGRPNAVIRIDNIYSATALGFDDGSGGGGMPSAPEPATLSLLAVGIGTLMLRRRRK